MSAPKLDPFLSAQLRIGRAEEHINTLNAETAQFWAKKPYAHAIDTDPDGRYKVHKIKFAERFPDHWRVLATEVIEHLRASLDHATWATAYLRTRNPEIEQAGFPFAKTAAALDNSIKRRSKNLPADIQTLLRGFQPYDGGNEVLYALNDLCNVSKHALIALTVVAVFPQQFVIFRQTPR